MRWLRFLLLRMHCPYWLLPDEGVDKETDSYEYERYAEDLSHVQDHVLLKAHLRFLYELNDEAHSEQDDEEHTDKGSSVHPVHPELVEAYQDDSENSIAQCLVKLGRMLWQGFSAKVEDEAPRKIGDITVYLRIAEISKPDEHGGKAYRDAEMIKNPYEIEIMFPAVMICKPYHCYKQSNSSSVAGQSPLPRHEYFHEALPASEVVFRLIEDAVTQTGTYDGTDKKRIEKRVQKRLRYILSVNEPFEYIPSENETGDEQESVPAQRKTADMEDLRIHAPVDCQCFKHMHIKKQACENSQAL